MAYITIAKTKDRLRIPQLLRILGYEGDFSKNPCCCPFHEDRSASFSISPDGKLCNCFAGCVKGSAIDVLMKATGLSEKEACRKFIEMAARLPMSTLPEPPPRRESRQEEKRALPNLPPMDYGTPEDHEALAALRHVSIEAVRVAEVVGVLRFGEWRGQPAWFVRDPGGRVAQARRMDRQLWACGKVANPKNSWASWPVGAGVKIADQSIALCEGGPDLLAAWHFIHCQQRREDVFAVAMLGAGHKIHPEALPWFANRRVRIFTHGEESGRKGAARWAEQLASVGCRVDAVDCGKLTGKEHGDLNDLTQTNSSDLEGLLPE